MQPDWASLLMKTGAVLGDHGVLHFGDPERELRIATSGDIQCDLSQQGLIAAFGPDTPAFLQGQVTSDVRQLTPTHSQLSAYCSPKGRMLAIFRLFRRGDSYYLRMPRERIEPLLKRLRLFVLRAKTTLEDASDQLVRIGLAGPHAAALLENALGMAPAQVDAVVQTKEITAIRLPGPQPRFELHGGLQDISALWNAFLGRTTPVGAEPWHLLDILAGIPTVYTETTEAFVPQMTNLQLINGVSFRKGCYTGQEIVARTQHLGRLKRRMYLAQVDSATRPHPGDELFSPQTGTTQSAGKIVAACRHPEGSYAVLAVVAIDCAEDGRVLLGDATGAALNFAPLPYAFADNTA